jgi:hypothetical protein
MRLIIRVSILGRQANQRVSGNRHRGVLGTCSTVASSIESKGRPVDSSEFTPSDDND